MKIREAVTNGVYPIELTIPHAEAGGYENYVIKLVDVTKTGKCLVSVSDGDSIFGFQIEVDVIFGIKSMFALDPEDEFVWFMCNEFHRRIFDRAADCNHKD